MYLLLHFRGSRRLEFHYRGVRRRRRSGPSNDRYV